MHDYYQILSVSPSATHAEIKQAYHSLLLTYHPDKSLRSQNRNAATTIDIALLKEAYVTLSAPISREKYNASLRKHQEQAQSLAPRPAQVVSLEDFILLDGEECWEYPCRCGGSYRITECDMENGQHVVGCRSCSEVIWVGYEVQEDKDEKLDESTNNNATI